MKHLTLAILTVTGTIFCGSVTAADTKLIKECEECHKDNGTGGEKHTPSIAGIHPDFFVESMAMFKSGERPTPNEDAEKMKKAVDKLSEAQINELAAYYSKQQFKPRDQKFDTAKAKAGSKHHKKYCAKCHEDNGKANTDGAAILAGQPMEYLRASMKAYADKSRPMGKSMAKKIKALHKKAGEKGIEEVIQFYASQK